MLQERFNDWDNVVYFFDDKTDFGYEFEDSVDFHTETDSDGNLCVYVDEDTPLPQLSFPFDDIIVMLGDIIDSKKSFGDDPDFWFYVVLKDGTLVFSGDIDFDNITFDRKYDGRRKKTVYKTNIFNFDDIIGVWLSQAGWEYVAYDTNPNNIKLVAEKFELPLI